MFDKPRKSKPKYLDDDGVFRYPDLREVCDMKSAKGRREYSRRIREMWERQGKRCGLIISPQCKERNGRLLINEAQFDHSFGRGMGGAKRTDAILDKNGNWLNQSVCCWCNCLKGSAPLTNFIDDIVP
jgi:hypothetical protein